MTHSTRDRAGDKRSQVQLSSKVEKTLVAYAVAASAAAVGVLASSPVAEAKIVYTPANVPISGRPTPIDLNHDGVNDFFLFHYFLHTDTGGNVLQACLNPVVNTRTVCISSYGTNIANAFRVAKSMGTLWGAALKRGAKIARGDRFRSMHAATLGGVGFPTSSHQKPSWFGPWMDGGKGVKNRYVGIKFKINGRFHFGWARVTVTTQEKSFTATLTGYAYETVPGRGIVAGKTRGPHQIADPASNSAPHAYARPPATLGVLALGAQGVSARR